MAVVAQVDAVRWEATARDEGKATRTRGQEPGGMQASEGWCVDEG
jgi:hypothetical protein